MKKTVVLFLLVLSVVGACGCAEKPNRRIEDYLSQKYQQPFTFISEGGGVWSDRTKTAYYADQEGLKFAVRYTDNLASDNYYSAIYDGAITQRLRDAMQTDCKVLASTKAAFFGENQSFSDINEYMKQCPVINVSIIVTRENSFTTVASDVLSAADGATISAVITCVPQRVFNGLTSAEDEIAPGDIVSYGSFWVENGALVRATWEDYICDKNKP